MGPHDRAGPRVAGCSRLSARFAGLPLRVRAAASLGAGPWPGGWVATVGPVSTRKLIAAALLCGVAILVAGTVLLLRAGEAKDRVDRVPAPTSTTRR